MFRKILLAAVALAGLTGIAHAQTSCTVQTQSQLLFAFADNVAPASIVPANIRNLVCSVPGLAGSTLVLPMLGGTGVANSNSDTITLGGAVNLAGAFSTTGASSLNLTTTGTTNITLPTSGTLLGNSLGSAQLFVGSAGGVATATTLTGDAAITNAGVSTVAHVNGVAYPTSPGTNTVPVATASNTITYEVVPSLAGGTGVSNAGTITTSGNASLGAGGTFIPGHGLIGVQTFCASGCTHTGGTFTPDTGTLQLVVEVQAPGGGSGGCAATGASTSCVSGGGGAGAYYKALIQSAFSGVTVTVGSAGAAGTAGTNSGGNGGTTSFGSLISCPGGIGSVGGTAVAPTAWSNAGTGSTIGSACTVSGVIFLSSDIGQQGANGMISAAVAGAQLSGGGGNSQLGRGGKATSSPTQQVGVAATGFGGGASGSTSIASEAAIAGQSGGLGLVIVYELN